MVIPFQVSGQNNGILAFVVRLGDCGPRNRARECAYGTVFLIGNKFLHCRQKAKKGASFSWVSGVW